MIRTPSAFHAATRRPERARALARVATLLAVLTATVGLLLAPGVTARAEPNTFEQQRIEQSALEALGRMLDLWREEVYFELYDFGTEDSRARLTREAFAQRMVELDWVPAAPPNPRHVMAHFRFRTMVYVDVRVPYRSKFDPDNRFTQQQTLLLLQEGGEWKVDLVRLVRAPYT